MPKVAFTVNGSAPVNGVITIGQLSSGVVFYNPPANNGVAGQAFGSPLTSFTFQITDSGNTTNGGQNVDTTTSVPPAALTAGITSGSSSRGTAAFTA